MKRLWIGMTLLFHSGLPCQAQKTFTEGILSYSLTISAAPVAPGQEQEASLNGRMQITVKGSKLAKELSLASGMSNLFVVRGEENLAFSLLTANNKKYAIEFNAAELKKKRQPCDKVKLEQLPDNSQTIAGFKASRVRVNCGAANGVTVYYTPDWAIDNNFIFEELPGFNYLPLAFDVTDQSGRVLHYELKKCSPQPIDESTFRIPADYKIITEKEYRQLAK